MNDDDQPTPPIPERHWTYFSAETRKPSMLYRGRIEPVDEDGMVLVPGEYVGLWTLGEDGVPVPVPRAKPLPVTVEKVKLEAKARLAGSDWRVMRAVEDADHPPVPVPWKQYRSAVREASNALGEMVPIPLDYQADHWWPTPPAD